MFHTVEDPSFAEWEMILADFHLCLMGHPLVEIDGIGLERSTGTRKHKCMMCMEYIVTTNINMMACFECYRPYTVCGRCTGLRNHTLNDGISQQLHLRLSQSQRMIDNNIGIERVTAITFHQGTHTTATAPPSLEDAGPSGSSSSRG